ncbi:unnamed protein product [Haemonchus placei]|uniref:Transposase n=1 Tax=Haemonchus placei TaxID=6290 RepID=A0A0N4WD23_HAEPC|nr:unnamed protein product [Haemonchus placei]
MVEQMLAEATADRLIRPSQPVQLLRFRAVIPGYSKLWTYTIRYARYYMLQLLRIWELFSNLPMPRARRTKNVRANQNDHGSRQVREQIKALSLSLRENQSALEHSGARINALIKRNERLANSTFGNSRDSAHTNQPIHSFLFLFRTIAHVSCQIPTRGSDPSRFRTDPCFCGLLTEEKSAVFPVIEMRGHRFGDIWFGDSREFAPFWTDFSDRVQDCGPEFTVSDQGYAIATVSRSQDRKTVRAGMIHLKRSNIAEGDETLIKNLYNLEEKSCKLENAAAHQTQSLFPCL